MDKQKILIVLGFIVMFALGMASLQFIRSVEVMSEDTLEEIKYNSSLIGYNTAISQILSEVVKCQQPLPITFQNETYNLVLIECLNLNNMEEKK